MRSGTTTSGTTTTTATDRSGTNTGRGDRTIARGGTATSGSGCADHRRGAQAPFSIAAKEQDRASQHRSVLWDTGRGRGMLG